MFSTWALALLGLAASAYTKSSTGNSVLVVLEPTLDKDNYSIFFNGLTENGYDLTFRTPRDVKPAVIEDDVPQFSHVVIFAPDTKSTYPCIYISGLWSGVLRRIRGSWVGWWLFRARSWFVTKQLPDTPENVSIVSELQSIINNAYSLPQTSHRT